MEGCTGYNIDAIKAFNQIKLPPTEPPLWCMLPRHRWPKEWEGKYERPVVRQLYNLYGHPRAGHYWEQHVHKCALIEGFKPVPGWECLYIHPEDQVLMSVYVDDFKLAGNASTIDACLNRLRKHMKLDDAIPICEGIYLGLTQRDIKCPPDLLLQKQDNFDLIMNAKHPTALPQKEIAEGVLYGEIRSKNRPESNEEVVSAGNENPTGVSASQGSSLAAESATPHSKKFTDWKYASVPRKSADQVKAYECDMSGHVRMTVERYCKFAKVEVKSLLKVATPNLDDHSFTEADFTSRGQLSSDSCKIVLQALWPARLARPEILWTVNTLAREVTKWTVACDKRLERLISYMHHHASDVQISFVGDTPADCGLFLYCDASFAADLPHSKSTSGAFLALVGPNTFCPISWMVKRQGCVTHSSSEAEIASLDASVRMMGIPCLQLWDVIVEMFTRGKGEKPAPRNSGYRKGVSLTSYDIATRYHLCTSIVEAKAMASKCFSGG
jgi:hypothetical protein